MAGMSRKHFEYAAKRVAAILNRHDRHVVRVAFVDLFAEFGERFDADRFFEATAHDPVAENDYNEGYFDSIVDALGDPEVATLAMDSDTDRRRMAQWIVNHYVVRL